MGLAALAANMSWFSITQLSLFSISSQIPIMPQLARPQQSKRWCFTLNNWTLAEYDLLIAFADQQCSYLIAGKETGASGTPHLQGFFILNSRKRITQLRQFDLFLRAHLEPARGTSVQASQYCSKEDADAFVHGTLPQDGPKKNIFDSFREWVEDQPVAPSLRQVWLERPEMVRYGTQVQECIRLFGRKPAIVDGQLRGWQMELTNLVDEDPDDRKIIFVVDELGNTGKSWLTRYWYTKRDDMQMLSVGKRDDLCYAVDETKRLFVFDVPRKCMEYFQYPVIEALKNQMLFSSKYKSQTKIIAHKVHVVVFCNEQPDRNAMTNDRFHVINIRAI